MAAMSIESVCPLCGNPVQLLDTFFRASGDFLPKKDPLQRFCNAPLHWECYEAWPERPRFARHYIDTWVKTNRKNPFWWCVHLDDDVYISANPQQPVEEASVRLVALGNDIRVPLPRWAEWLANVDAVTPGLQPLERRVLDAVLPRLRERFPDDHAVVDAIDPDEKHPRSQGKQPAISRSKAGD